MLIEHLLSFQVSAAPSKNLLRRKRQREIKPFLDYLIMKNQQIRENHQNGVAESSLPKKKRAFLTIFLIWGIWLISENTFFFGKVMKSAIFDISLNRDKLKFHVFWNLVFDFIKKIYDSIKFM